jgi:hypothetical protein
MGLVGVAVILVGSGLWVWRGKSDEVRGGDAQFCEMGGCGEGFLFQGRERQLGEGERKKGGEGCRSFESDGFRVRVSFFVFFF